MLYNNLAKLYEQMGKIDTALAMYKKCLIKSKEIGSNNTSDVETNISNIFLDKNEIDSSLHYLERALENSLIKGKNSREHIHALQMLSNIEKKKGNIKKAIEILSEAFYLSKGVGLLSEMEVFSRELSTNFDIYGKKDSALFFLTTHIEIKDTLEKQSSKEKLIARIEKGKLDSMQIRTQLLEAEKEYLNLEISKKESTVVLISCLLICVVILILVLIRSYKRKKLIMEYQIKENETTISTKNKELIGVKLEIVAHSDALNQLNKKITHKLSEKYDPEFDDLSNILRQSVHFSNSSEKKKYLNDLVKLDNDFYKTLKSRYATLTEDELKLSALIRLNLSSDELLDIFRISKSSLNTKRYRLRKKLLLKKNQSLDEFIKLL
jgi:tetratricopeptide (TPR) repeat protein